MLYIIGLGLNIDGISNFGLDIVKRSKKIYLENYTVDFPYSKGELENFLGKKLHDADRDFVEGLTIIDEAKKKDVVLLVYGSPLTATTHITIIEEAKNSGIRTKIIYNASILDAIAETGLQLYKFGKFTSIPKWTKSFRPISFMEYVEQNRSIDAHTLLLVDIGLDFQDALDELDEAAKKHKLKLGKVLVCQSLGTKKRQIIFRKIEELRAYKNVQSPYCFIIPSKLHFVEKDALKKYDKR